MTLSISPILPSVAAQAAALDVALQPGTVVSAQVLQLLDADLVRMVIANLTLDVATTLPLQPGQTLQLAVTQTKNGISLAQVVPEPAAGSLPVATARGNAVVLDDIPLAPAAVSQSEQPGSVKPALSAVEIRAVTTAAQIAVTKQASLSPLFANLTSAVTSGTLPQPVLVAAAQLLSLRQPPGQIVTGVDIKAALASSGLMMEAGLASGTSAAALPDIKAALSVLRQALATWIDQPADKPQASNVVKNLVTRGATATLAAALPAGVQTTSDAIDDPGSAAIARTSLASVATGLLGARTGEPALVVRSPAPTPPPFAGALPAAQPVASPSLAPGAEPVAIAQQLIADTDGALARQTLLQIASLPDRVDIAMLRGEATQPRWNFEIPFVTPQGTAMAQFEIARDGGGHESDPAKRVWRARFCLDIEPAGPVHALISFSGDKTSVKMWAERPATAAQLRANAMQLGASLDRAELKTGDIVIADGAPSRGPMPSAGHFLNRAS